MMAAESASPTTTSCVCASTVESRPATLENGAVEWVDVPDTPFVREVDGATVPGGMTRGSAGTTGRSIGWGSATGVNAFPLALVTAIDTARYAVAKQGQVLVKVVPFACGNQPPG
jgi:hypothetical protein